MGEAKEEIGKEEEGKEDKDEEDTRGRRRGKSGDEEVEGEQ